MFDGIVRFFRSLLTSSDNPLVTLTISNSTLLYTTGITLLYITGGTLLYITGSTLLYITGSTLLTSVPVSVNLSMGMSAMIRAQSLDLLVGFE